MANGLREEICGCLRKSATPQRAASSNSDSRHIFQAKQRIPVNGGMETQRARRTQSPSGVDFSTSSAPSAFPILETLERAISGATLFQHLYSSGV